MRQTKNQQPKFCLLKLIIVRATHSLWTNRRRPHAKIDFHRHPCQKSPSPFCSPTKACTMLLSSAQQAICKRMGFASLCHCSLPNSGIWVPRQLCRWKMWHISVHLPNGETCFSCPCSVSCTVQIVSRQVCTQQSSIWHCRHSWSRDCCVEYIDYANHGHLGGRCQIYGWRHFNTGLQSPRHLPRLNGAQSASIRYQQNMNCRSVKMNSKLVNWSASQKSAKPTWWNGADRTRHKTLTNQNLEFLWNMRNGLIKYNARKTTNVTGYT